MWYGCGNTSLPNPSTVRVGLKADGRIALHQGAVDIGQGSNTIVTQICADALGAPIERFDLVSGDTSITPDCGKTSASRQTFVTGKAALYGRPRSCAAQSCVWRSRASALRLISEPARSRSTKKAKHRTISLRDLPLDKHGYVHHGRGNVRSAHQPAR